MRVPELRFDAAERRRQNWMRLGRHFSAPGLVHILWVSYDHAQQREGLMEDFKQQMPARRHVVVSLNGWHDTGLSLRGYLAGAAAAAGVGMDEGGAVLHVTDAEDYITNPEEAIRLAFVGDINLGREGLFRDHVLPFVFWATEYATGVLRRAAVDFWSWVERGYYFEREAAEPKVRGLPVSAAVKSASKRPGSAAELAQIDLLRSELALLGPAGNERQASQCLTYYQLLATLYEKVGDYDALRELAAGIEGELLPHLGEAPLLQAVMYELKGKAAYRQYAYAESLEATRQGLELLEGIFPGLHPDVATAYHSLGVTYRAMGEAEQGLAYLQRGLAMRQAVLPEGHPDLAASYHNVGIAYDVLGDYGQALQMKYRALDIRERLPEGYRGDLAKSYNSLGFTYEHIGNRVEAYKLFKEGLELRKSLYAYPHIDLIRSYNNVGSVLKALGQAQEGLEMQAYALAQLLEFEVREPMAEARLRNNIGYGHLSLRQYAKAEEALLRAKALYEGMVPVQGGELRQVHENLIELYQETGRAAEAAAMMQKVLGGEAG